MSISEHRSKKGVLTDDMRFQLLLSGFIKSSQWIPHSFRVGIKLRKFSEINFYSCHFVL